MPGPGGLFCVYTPYPAPAERSIINFNAVEPFPAGQIAGGFSELFETKEVFRQGVKYVLGIASSDPEIFIKKLKYRTIRT